MNDATHKRSSFRDDEIEGLEGVLDQQYAMFEYALEEWFDFRSRSINLVGMRKPMQWDGDRKICMPVTHIFLALWELAGTVAVINHGRELAAHHTVID